MKANQLQTRKPIIRLPSQIKQVNNSTMQFVDKNMEANVLGKFSQIANNSPQELQMAAVGKLLNSGTKASKMKKEDPLLGKLQLIQKMGNHTGIAAQLNSNIVNPSGFTENTEKVHFNSNNPTNLGAHSYALDTDNNFASGQDKQLPHEAWKVVQQKQSLPSSALQNMAEIRPNANINLKRKIGLKGKVSTGIIQRSENQVLGTNINSIVFFNRNQQVVQFGAGKHPKIVKGGGGKATGKAKGGEERYPGHDSKNNKKALINVLNHRKGNLYKILSHPEETAHGTNQVSKKPETGKANITHQMPVGTAICHKISDKSIRDKIEFLFNAEMKKGNKSKLDSYLENLIDYINPDHLKDETPTGGDYEKEVNKNYEKAWDASLEMILLSPGSKKRLVLAHVIGKNVANSPINLFLGDSITNSSIQANFDQNTYAAAPYIDAPPTPRSARAKPVNELVNKDYRAKVLPSNRTKKSSRPGDN